MIRRLEQNVARRAETGTRTIVFEFEGTQIAADPDDSVAAALLMSGVRTTRTSPVSGAPRAPFCMMGSCFDCFVEIDGIPNRQACMVMVQPGMVVRQQIGAPELALGSHEEETP